MASGFHNGTFSTRDPIVNAGYLWNNASAGRWYGSYGKFNIDTGEYTQEGTLGPISSTSSITLLDLAQGYYSTSDYYRRIKTLKRCYWSSTGLSASAMSIKDANTVVASAYSGGTSIPNQYFRDIADWE